MGTYSGEKSTLGRIIGWFFVALLAIAALKLAFWTVGMVVGVGALLLFKVAPVVVAGWLVVQVIRYLGRPRGYPDA